MGSRFRRPKPLPEAGVWGWVRFANAAEANKPEAILAKIAEGKMRKFFEENTLLNQALVGEKISIREFLQQNDKEATVVAYKRFALEA